MATRARLLSVAVAACYASVPVWANPTNPVVTNGSAAFSQAGSVLTVTNSSGAIINWDTFSIGAGETTRFIQSSAASSVLNRVVTNNPSQLYGTLSSNGQVWLINTAGILVGAGAVIDTARFVASTLQVRDADFLAGRLSFGDGSSALNGITVEKGATITTPSGGSVYLIGANVSNEGLITTPSGETILAAGQTVNLIDTGTPGVKVEITGATGNTTNLGEIVADAGRIGMAGVIVRNSGTLNASSVVNEGGRIFLKASQDTYVDGAGRIVATGTKGGNVQVLGNRVAVMDSASIDASGANGGGTVLVGGDLHGANPDVQNAAISYFGPQATIRADATDNGDGGKVIVWADDTTRAYGTISARGGPNGGNGGFVETSGHNYLDFHASVDTRAPNGQAGTLLLDPADVTITNSTTANGSFSGGIFTSSNTPSTLNWSDIISQLGSGNVVVTTTYGGGGGTGDITIAQSPSGGSNITISHTDSWGTWTNTWPGVGYNSANSLTLLANHAVNINAVFGNAGSGAINIMAGWDGVSTSTPAMYGGFTAGQSININGGGGIVSMGSVKLSAVDTVAITGGGINGMAGIDMNAGDLFVTANKVSLTSSGTGVYNGTAARIASNGNQTFTVGIYNSAGGLYLQGDTGGATYGGNAEIGLYSSTGTQSFTIQNGATVQVYGGSSTGLAPASWFTAGTDCAVGTICSNNYAQIRTAGSGGQSFNFTAGGNLYIHGGNSGNDNFASIDNRGAGSQSITGNPMITIQGGSSGGATAAGTTQTYYFDNSAGLDSHYGSQTINASAITLTGGSATYGGAYLSATTQNITVTGAVSMTGGSGTAPSAYDAFGDPIMFNPAIIGSDMANTVTLNVGSLTMNGGSASDFGGSGALIGGYHVPTTVSITSSGNIALNSANQGGDRIGSFGGFGGALSLTSNVGTIGLGKGFVGTGSTGSVLLSAYGGITQTGGPTGGVIGTSALAATTSNGNIGLQGFNQIGYVLASAPGAIMYTGASTVNLGFSTSSSGSVTVNGYGGTFVSNIGAAEPSSLAVYNLGTSYGGWATYTTGNNVSLGANYTLSSTNGGVSLYSAGTVAVSNISGLQTSANPLYGYIDIWGNAGLTTSGALSTSSDLFLGTSGNMSVANSISAYDVGLYAGGTITTTGASIGATYDVGMWSNSGITLTSSSVTASSGNAYLGSGGLSFSSASGGYSFTGGGSITLTGSSVSAPVGNIYAATGGDLRLNSGSSFSAGYDIYVDLLGAMSTLYLNDATGMSASTISVGVPYTIYLDFPARSSGGIVIDGAAATSPVTTTAGGSGFYANGAPAIGGTTLKITYGLMSLADPCVINPSSCAPPPPPGPTNPGVVVPPPTGPGGTGSLTNGGTTGGGTDEFGGTSSEGNGDKDKDKDKQSSSDSSSGNKKDDSGKKPVGKCSA